MATDAKQPPLALLIKIGSIVVHAGEMLDEKAPLVRSLDEQQVRTGLADPEVAAWIEAMGPLLPLRRDVR